LGEVTYVGIGRTGFQDLLRAAKRQYPDADYIIDIMIDRQVTTFIFLDFKATSYTMRATAIKYIRNTGGVVSQSPAQSPAANSSVRNYTVRNVTGTVWRQAAGGSWQSVKIGDVIDSNTYINTTSDSTLILADGNNTITIPSGKRDRLVNIISGM